MKHRYYSTPTAPKEYIALCQNSEQLGKTGLCLLFNYPIFRHAIFSTFCASGGKLSWLEFTNSGLGMPKLHCFPAKAQRTTLLNYTHKVCYLSRYVAYKSFALTFLRQAQKFNTKTMKMNMRKYVHLLVVQWSCNFTVQLQVSPFKLFSIIVFYLVQISLHPPVKSNFFIQAYWY